LTSQSPDSINKSGPNFYGAKENEKVDKNGETKQHKIKVLKPIINYNHNANKLLGEMVRI